MIFAAAAAATALFGQTITGSISGTVSDPTGLSVTDAKVSLLNTGTGAQRQVPTTATGEFIFHAVDPGAYEVTVEASGFRKLRRTGVNLTASERLSLGTLALEIGSVAESVTVQSQGAAVQVASSERSGVLTSSQIENIQIKGRNVMTLLQLLPGVVDTSNPDGPDRNFAIGMSVNGDRRNAIGSWLDGVPTQDSGVGWIATLNVSMDSVSEVKVLLNNYQAEYGRMRGAGVQMVSKSGTRDFHGSFSYFKRHEQFNANNFFNNRTVVNGAAIPKPRYRYNTFSYTIGGPVYIPKLFNRDKQKVFFFWSQELWPQRSGVGPSNVSMPTAAERTGDFSNSLDVNNRLIPVRDPNTGQPFAGNIVPPTRLDPNGQALLRLLPLPNFFDRSISGGQFNYVFQGEIERPQRLQTLKVDLNANPNNQVAVTWSRQEDKQVGNFGLATPSPNWGMLNRTFVTRGNILSGRYQKIISPTLVNELVLGYNWRWESELIPPGELAKFTRASIGYRAPQLFAAANPLELIPNVTFGGIPNAASITLTNIPIEAIYPTYILTDNITKTLRTHTLKAGIFYNRPAVRAIPNTNRGALSFATDVNNPLETGYTYANAALGVFNTATQANRIVHQGTVLKSFEWFGQDSWKVHKRFTLEVGMRMVWAPPAYQNQASSVWSPRAWDPARRPSLIEPVLSGGRRVGRDPRTGELYPAVAIGAIAPGSGDFANGFIINTQPGVPRGLVTGYGVLYSPRLGFAWDLFGDGKTAIRGGFGLFQSAGATGEGSAGSLNRIPMVVTGTVYYGTLGSLGGSSGLIFPSGATAFQDPIGAARSYNMNLGVQRNVGWGTILDVSYVGTLGRHLRWSFDLDPLPIGTNFDPKNLDSTTGRVLPAQFLRRYLGYTGASYNNWGASSNYHSLQTMVNRRFAKGMQFGASWTWSKYLSVVDFDDNGVNPFVPARVWNYGLSTYDRTHNLRINFQYDVPKVPWKVAPARWVLNDWQLSGILSYISGSPFGVGLSTTNNADITGTPSQGPRVVLVGNPVLPKGERTFARNFRTDVFRLPAVGTLGNAGRAYLRGPGVENWDLSVFKNIPIHEKFRAQFRAEFYNAFNHTQFSGLDTTARFDPAGNQVNPTLGQFTGARTPRQIQLSIRATF